VFSHGKLFQASLILVVKPGAYPISFSPLGYAPGLTCKNKTRLERPAKDKHSSTSLLPTFVNYIGQLFNITGPRSMLGCKSCDKRSLVSGASTYLGSVDPFSLV
jgi:hypothetical protein